MTGQAGEGSRVSPGIGPQPFGEIVQLTVTAQHRSLELAQAWTDSLVGLLREQVEGNRAVFEALASSLTAMERALASQEETNRALRQSLEAQREVVQRASDAQERGARLIQTALESLAAATQAQLDATRALLSPMAPSGSGQDPFTELVRQWNAALQWLLEAGGAGSAGAGRARPGGRG
jgi:ABC-type transporter Mla subunit MlaD